jgi:hypothetical protein
MPLSRLLAAALALGGLIAFAAAIRAQDNMTVTMHGFQDTRGVTVLSPLLTLDKDFTDRTGLRLRFGVDAVSAASDSCARCHQEGANNGRVFLNASAVRTYGDTKLSVGGEVSRENFYAADTVMASVSRALNKANTTVSAGYSLSFNRPGLHPLEEVEHQHGQDMYASLTQTLTRTTIVQLAYDFNRVTGYQSSPFLRTPVNGQMTVGVSPDLRNRQAFTARIRQALPAETFLEGDYRYYRDDWSLRSSSLGLGISHSFGARLLAAFTYRWYDQTGAFFYQPSYVGSPEFFTGDFRLAPFNSGIYSGRIVITPKGRHFNLPDGSAFEFEYDRYMANSAYQAAIFSGGVKIPLNK